jgi:fatty acid desaturase
MTTGDFSIGDDHSKDFAAIRTLLNGQDGGNYRQFLQSLRPDFRAVYRDIAIGYGFLALSLVLCALAPRWGLPIPVAVAGGALLVGFWVAHLQLFLHEGSHYNLARTKAASDRVCDCLISWMVGTSVAAYRIVHFQHHRALGTPQDSEFTYFFPLNAMFVIKGLFGVRALEVILARRKIGAPKQTEKQRAGLVPLAIGVSIHLAVMAICVLTGAWWAALAWAIGVGAVFPFFGALRQLLEHRDDTARASLDYTQTDHGAFTRLFGDDLFSRTFGGAGFNRHLLHHWEPQVSYTNLAQLEQFLAGSIVGPVIARRRTTYTETFRRLFRQQ